MKAGSWPSILGIYLFGICGGATVGKLIPLAAEIERTFGLSGSSYGWLVALVALPAALLAIPSGGVVDRWGSKRVLAVASVVGVAANATYFVAQALPVIFFARLVEGLAMVLMYTAGPAFLIAIVDGARRTKAMTLWSTYTPVGTALGLGAAGYIADHSNWRIVFIAHAGLFALAGVLLLIQPQVRQAPLAKKPLSQRLGELFSAFARPQLLALGVAFLLLVSLGMGVNITLPLMVSKVHSISTSAASSMVASVTLVMVAGSALAGLLLGRGNEVRSVFALLAASGFVAGSLSFYPDLPLAQRYAIMIAWFLTSGAALATVLAALPLAADPERPGAAAALLTFTGAVATFLTPPLWLGIFDSGQWIPFIGLLGAGWLAAVLLIGIVARTADTSERASSSSNS